MKNFFLFLSFVIASQKVIGQEKKYSTRKLLSSDKTFLCVMDKSTGFEFNQDSQSWNYKNLEVEDQKFILELDKWDTGTFYKFGSKNMYKKKISSKCKRSRKTRFIVCNGSLGDVNFNETSNLITYAFTFGYTVGNNSLWTSNSLGPSISIGKCSELNLNIK
tara:strand:- start:221 stop:706 length:486 start_codon:yes stop_codon:yes gene_type:complete